MCINLRSHNCGPSFPLRDIMEFPRALVCTPAALLQSYIISTRELMQWFRLLFKQSLIEQWSVLLTYDCIGNYKYMYSCVIISTNATFQNG